MNDFRGDVTDVSATVENAVVCEQVAAFRRMRGFGAPEACARPVDTSTAVFIKFGDVFVDERSGWIHLCDETCTEARPDDGNNSMVRA